VTMHNRIQGWMLICFVECISANPPPAAKARVFVITIWGAPKCMRSRIRFTCLSPSTPTYWRHNQSSQSRARMRRREIVARPGKQKRAQRCFPFPVLPHGVLYAARNIVPAARIVRIDAKREQTGVRTSSLRRLAESAHKLLAGLERIRRTHHCACCPVLGAYERSQSSGSGTAIDFRGRE